MRSEAGSGKVGFRRRESAQLMLMIKRKSLDTKFRELHTDVARKGSKK